MDLHLDLLTSMLKILADTSRLRILLCLGKNTLSVSQIVGQTGMSQPLVSHHLRFLKSSRLVKTERKGPFVYYRLAFPGVLGFLDEGNDIALHLERGDMDNGPIEGR